MRTLRRIDLTSLKMMFAIALAAMVVRAMVPAGWMIMPDPVTGLPSMQPCSGKMTLGGTAPAPLGVQGKDRGHDMHGAAHAHHAMAMDMPVVPAADDGGHDHDYAEVPCPFALSSLLSLAGEGFVLIEPHVPAAPDRAVPPVRGPPLLRVTHAPLPARGPPSSV